MHKKTFPFLILLFCASCLLHCGKNPLSPDTHDIFKTVPVNLVTADSICTFGTCYVTRDLTTTEYAKTVIPVVNVTSMPLPYLKFNIEYSDEKGDLIDSGFTFASGTVMHIIQSSYTNTCVLPGDTGYIIDICSNAFSRIAEVTITGISYYTSSIPTLPEAVIDITGYTTSSDSILVSVHNSGPCQALLETSQLILLDEQGKPVTWLFSTTLDNIPVAPGSSGQLLFRNLLFSGNWSDMILLPDFSDQCM